MTQQDKENIISRILELELENCDRIFKGIKPEINDSFSDKRKELEMLRCLLYGYNSIYCKIKKRVLKGPFSIWLDHIISTLSNRMF